MQYLSRHVSLSILTTNDIQRGFCDEWIDINNLIDLRVLLQPLHQYVGFLREYFAEAVQNFEMEGGCDDLAMFVPSLIWNLEMINILI